MLEPSSALTWTAMPLPISRSETLASAGAVVVNASPLSSLPVMLALPLAPVAMVTDWTLPESTCLMKSE